MPRYNANALSKFQHVLPSRPEHAPHTGNRPTDGAKEQLAKEDKFASLSTSQIIRIQQIVGTLLCYARAVDSTMLVAHGTLAKEQTKGTEQPAQAVTQLLSYAAT